MYCWLLELHEFSASILGDEMEQHNIKSVMYVLSSIISEPS